MRFSHNSLRREVSRLYGSYVRETRRLPHLYLRLFFRVKISDDIRSLLTAEKLHVFQSKFSRIKQDLLKLRSANAKDKKAYESILDLAYGRKGKLRWEIMKPLLSDPNASPPPRIIPSVKKSRPPTFSPEMRVLLTTVYSRRTKALVNAALEVPPPMPVRADPNSDEAKLLGPLSKRRQVNIRWRYFTEEWKKVLPPLQVSVRESFRAASNVKDGNNKEAVTRARIRDVGMQGSGVVEELLSLTCPPVQTAIADDQQHVNSVLQAGNVVQPLSIPIKPPPTRWIRRRYQELLGRLPILTYTYSDKPADERRGRYTVSLAENALGSSVPKFASKFAEVDDVDLTWIEAAHHDSSHCTK